jgi:hypothetical protein
MDVPGDPTPFRHQRLLGKLAPGRIQLGSQLGLTRQRTPDHPGKGDTQDADAHIDLRGVLNHPLNHRRSRHEQTERDRSRQRPRPAANDEGEQRELQHERLQLTRSQRHDHRDHHRHRDQPERDTRRVDPEAESRDRDRCEDQPEGRRWIHHCGDDGDHQHKQRHQAKHVVGYPRRPT